MSVLFGELVSRLKSASSPSEREGILSAAVAAHNIFTCQQLGIILMHMKYSSERKSVAAMLGPQVVDAENAACHLLPYIAGESHDVRETILQSVTSLRE